MAFVVINVGCRRERTGQVCSLHSWGNQSITVSIRWVIAVLSLHVKANACPSEKCAEVPGPTACLCSAVGAVWGVRAHRTAAGPR